MVPIGGVGWMLVLAAASGLCCLVVALAVGRRMGPVAGLAWGGLTAGLRITKAEPLFPRIDEKEE